MIQGYEKKLNVLILTNELNITCGVSSSINSFLSNLPEDCAISFYLITGGGDAVDRFRPLVKHLIVNPSVRHQDRSPLNFLKGIYLIIDFCLRNKINIIHSHTHYTANLGFIASKFMGSKTIQSIHGIIPDVGFLSHFIADRYIAVNEHIIEYLGSNLRLKAGKLKNIPYGYSFPKTIPNKSLDRIVFILGSRLIYEKGIDIFISAVKRLPSNVKFQCDFWIAGNGVDEDAFKELAKDEPIRFLGSVDDFEKLLFKSHIFILPSRSKAEGFPTAIIQAALTGNLIISSKFLGSNTILKNNYNALLFDCDDINRLTYLMVKASTDIKEFELLIQRSFSDFKRKYDVLMTGYDMIKFYSEI